MAPRETMPEPNTVHELESMRAQKQRGLEDTKKEIQSLYERIWALQDQERSLHDQIASLLAREQALVRANGG